MEMPENEDDIKRCDPHVKLNPYKLFIGQLLPTLGTKAGVVSEPEAVAFLTDAFNRLGVPVPGELRVLNQKERLPACASVFEVFLCLFYCLEKCLCERWCLNALIITRAMPPCLRRNGTR